MLQVGEPCQLKVPAGHAEQFTRAWPGDEKKPEGQGWHTCVALAAAKEPLLQL